MRKIALLVLGAVALGGLLWLVLARARVRESARAMMEDTGGEFTAPAVEPETVTPWNDVESGAARSPQRPLSSAATSPKPRESTGQDGPSFCGKVLDGVTGRPLAAVRVQILAGIVKIDAGLPVSALGIRAETGTDAEGRFRLVRPLPDRTEQGFLSREGHGFLRFLVEKGHETEERASVFELLPCASLVVSVHDASGEPQVGTLVTLTGRGEPLDRSDSVRLDAGLRWSETTASDGAARFACLPAETGFDLRLGPERTPRERLALAAGETRALDCVLEFALVHGLVLDAERQPVPRCALTFKRAEGDTFARRAAEETRATTDMQGRFELRNLSIGSWRVEAQAVGLAPSSERVVVDRPEVQLELHLGRGLPIAGRVVPGDGEEWQGVEGLDVYARALSIQTTAVSTKTREGGRFRFGGLAPGEYELYTYQAGRGSLLERVEAGRDDVELEIFLHRLVRVHLSGGAGDVELFVTDLLRDDSFTWDDQEIFEIPLSPGAYSLRFSTLDGRIGFLPRVDVPIEGPQEELMMEVVLEPGAELRVAQQASDSTCTLLLRQEGGLLQRVLLAPGESRKLLAPPGEVALELREAGHVVALESVQLAPGEQRRVVLGPR